MTLEEALKILELERKLSINTQIIKKQYNKLIMLYYPSSIKNELYEEIINDINLAYETLRNYYASLNQTKENNYLKFSAEITKEEIIAKIISQAYSETKKELEDLNQTFLISYMDGINKTENPINSFIDNKYIKKITDEAILVKKNIRKICLEFVEKYKFNFNYSLDNPFNFFDDKDWYTKYSYQLTNEKQLTKTS